MEMRGIHSKRAFFTEMFNTFPDPQDGVMCLSTAVHFRCLQLDFRNGMKNQTQPPGRKRKIRSMKNTNSGDIGNSINH